MYLEGVNIDCAVERKGPRLKVNGVLTQAVLTLIEQEESPASPQIAQEHSYCLPQAQSEASSSKTEDISHDHGSYSARKGQKHQMPWDISLMPFVELKKLKVEPTSKKTGRQPV